MFKHALKDIRFGGRIGYFLVEKELLPLKRFDPLFIGGNDARMAGLDHSFDQFVDLFVGTSYLLLDHLGLLPGKSDLAIPCVFEHRSGGTREAVCWA